MFWGVIWALISLVSELYKRTHIVFDILITVCFVSLVYYLVEKFEKYVNLHPTIKWILSILIFLIGFLLYMKKGL
jgi:hypothetical protein